MSKSNETHFTKLYLLVVAPILALVFTPLFPFVNNGGFTFGLPNVCVWVMAWAVITSLILGFLFRHEPELDEEVLEILGESVNTAPLKKEVE